MVARRQRNSPVDAAGDYQKLETHNSPGSDPVKGVVTVAQNECLISLTEVETQKEVRPGRIAARC